MMRSPSLEEYFPLKQEARCLKSSPVLLSQRFSTGLRPGLSGDKSRQPRQTRYPIRGEPYPMTMTAPTGAPLMLLLRCCLSSDVMHSSYRGKGFVRDKTHFQRMSNVKIPVISNLNSPQCHVMPVQLASLAATAQRQLGRSAATGSVFVEKILLLA